MSQEEPLSPLGRAMVEGLSAFAETLDSGEPVERRFTVRTVRLVLEDRPYEGADVRRVRDSLGASQPLFANFLGVSVKTLRSWEQGLRPVPRIACRYLDDVMAHPSLFKDKLRVEETGRESIAN